MKKKIKILIVRSKYNDTIQLRRSALSGLNSKRIIVREIKVNGAFEIPVTIARNISKYDGFVAIGIILKGETPNFSLISQAITNGLMDLSILFKKPVGNAVLTCLNTKQAKKRNKKGKEAVDAVLSVLNPKDNYRAINFGKP